MLKSWTWTPLPVSFEFNFQSVWLRTIDNLIFILRFREIQPWCAWTVNGAGPDVVSGCACIASFEFRRGKFKRSEEKFLNRHGTSKFLIVIWFINDSSGNGLYFLFQKVPKNLENYYGSTCKYLTMTFESFTHEKSQIYVLTAQNHSPLLKLFWGK